MNIHLPTDNLLEPEKGCTTFEELKHENGNTYWLASELMEQLGYDGNWKEFSKAIRSATKTITGLNIDLFDNISKIRDINGHDDYKLTRFASYLVVMNSNPKLPQVARAQTYFYDKFHNAGYLGMYNMMNVSLTKMICSDEFSI